MADRVIQAGSEIAIRIDANRTDISRFVRQGDDLIVELRNGDRIIVEGYHVPHESGSLHSLVFGDLAGGRGGQ
ncbi:BapA prefix-like domain-containing protein [Ponticoccus litoralis]|uniref:BapA prefix-like domain-containing protein n=1 Tax=Ponticoccus litoralis TaxID=422297 RepID=A0AAW9S5M0_9RHOB